jgi:hypothetical protein
MFPNAKASELFSVLAQYNPVSVGASTVLTPYVPMANNQQLAALILTGVLGASATIDAKLVQATDSSGTNVKDITGKAITQLLKASADNKQVVINVRSSDLDVNNGFNYVALSITVGTAASIVAAVLLGFSDRFGPASDHNQAGVVQVL